MSSTILSRIRTATRTMLFLTASTITPEQNSRLNRPLFLPDVIRRAFKLIPPPAIGSVNRQHVDFLNGEGFSLEKLRIKLEEEKQESLKEEALRRLEEESKLIAKKKRTFKKNKTR